MTAYLLTPEVHQQVVDALTSTDKLTYEEWMRAHGRPLVEMLKAMKPQTPVAIVAKDGFAQINVGWRKIVPHNTELYTLGDTA